MKKTLIITAMLTTLAISGCKNKEKIHFKKAENGIEYYFVEQNKKNPQPKEKGGAIIDVKAYWKDSLIFDSRDVSPEFMVVIKNEYPGSIDQALQMMHQGDSAIFRLDAVKFLTKTANMKVPEYIKPGDKLTFYIRMQEVLDEKQVEAQHKKFLKYRRDLEPQLIDDYIQRHPDEDFKQLPSGLYIAVDTEGHGMQPLPGDSVFINYIGYFINGEPFASTLKKGKLFSFKIGDQKVIPGLELAVSMMKEGGVTTVIIPSYLAYGEEGLMNLIPPYSALVFKVELVKVKRPRVPRY